MNIFKRSRLLAGKTQKEVSQLLGVSCVSVGKWESGKVFPRPDRLKEIARVLNVNVDQLLGPPGNEDR